MAKHLPLNLKTDCTTNLAALAAEQTRSKASLEFPPPAAPTVARKLSKSVGSHLETAFLAAWRLVPGRPAPERNYRFHATRKWQFDFAWPDAWVAVEIEGGTQGRPIKCHSCGAKVKARKTNSTLGRELRIGGGHSRQRYGSDCAKYNTAWFLGWGVLRYTGEDLRERPAQVCEEIEQAINARGKP